MTNKKLLKAVEGKNHDRKPPYSRKARSVIQKWWDESINVNDLAGSLGAALGAAGFEIVLSKRPADAPSVTQEK